MTKQKIHFHYLPFIGLWMIGILVIIVAIVFPWWSNVLVRWNYGKARVSLFGFAVGHGGVSRFVSFEADEGQIVIVEIINKTYQVYLGELPINNLNPHRLISLQVRAAKENGLPDLLVNVEGEEQMVLINTGTGFTWTE